MTWDFKRGVLGGIFIKQNPFSEFRLFRRNFEIPKTTTTRPDHLDFLRIPLLESLIPRELEREREALKASIIFSSLLMLRKRDLLTINTRVNVQLHQMQAVRLQQGSLEELLQKHLKW